MGQPIGCLKSRGMSYRLPYPIGCTIGYSMGCIPCDVAYMSYGMSHRLSRGMPYSNCLWDVPWERLWDLQNDPWDITFPRDVPWDALRKARSMSFEWPRGCPMGCQSPWDIHNPMGRHHRMFTCLLYTSPSPRDKRQARMPSSA